MALKIFRFLALDIGGLSRLVKLGSSGERTTAMTFLNGEAQAKFRSKSCLSFTGSSPLLFMKVTVRVSCPVKAAYWAVALSGVRTLPLPKPSKSMQSLRFANFETSTWVSKEEAGRAILTSINSLYWCHIVFPYWGRGDALAIGILISNAMAFVNACLDLSYTTFEVRMMANSLLVNRILYILSCNSWGIIRRWQGPIGCSCSVRSACLPSLRLSLPDRARLTCEPLWAVIFDTSHRSAYLCPRGDVKASIASCCGG